MYFKFSSQWVDYGAFPFLGSCKSSGAYKLGKVACAYNDKRVFLYMIGGKPFTDKWLPEG